MLETCLLIAFFTVSFGLGYHLSNREKTEIVTEREYLEQRVEKLSKALEALYESERVRYYKEKLENIDDRNSVEL